MPRMIPDTAYLFDYSGNPRQSPEIRLKTVRLRPTTEGGIHLGQPATIKSGLAPGTPRGLQFFDASPAKAGKPSADALPTNMK